MSEFCHWRSTRCIHIVSSYGGKDLMFPFRYISLIYFFAMGMFSCQYLDIVSILLGQIKKYLCLG